jgi:hypothetical protein
MVERLYQLFFRNPRLELAIYGTAFGIALIYSGVKIFLLSTPESAAMQEAALLAVVVLGGSVFGYLIGQSTPSTKPENPLVAAKDKELRDAANEGLSHADLATLLAQASGALVEQFASKQAEVLAAELRRSLGAFAEALRVTVAKESNSQIQSLSSALENISEHEHQSLRRTLSSVLAEQTERMADLASRAAGQRQDVISVAVHDQIANSLPDLTESLKRSVESALREGIAPLLEELENRKAGERVQDVSLWDLEGLLQRSPGPESTTLRDLWAARELLENISAPREFWHWQPDTSMALSPRRILSSALWRRAGRCATVGRYHLDHLGIRREFIVYMVKRHAQTPLYLCLAERPAGNREVDRLPEWFTNLLAETDPDR